jgi:UDP-N-acetylglucosamine--N-acetylmuramyl-(pentapeptide) pyrophosphoryl-undecaprenol N-acetylglucosamine transferase
MSTLLVASTGGHLKELYNLKDRLTRIGGPFRWVTFDTPQSRSMLTSEIVDFVPFVGGRDPFNVMRNVLAARRILRDRSITTVVSTGSAVALPFFVLARARGLSCHFIESAARSDGPSMTGRLISRIPDVRLYAQYRSWDDERWQYRGSVFDAFEPIPPPKFAKRAPLKRIVVSLGTYRGYGFQRLVKRLLTILPADADVLWQTGDTDTSDLGIRSHYALPEDRLLREMRQADLVVAHAGVGTALAAFEVGKCPLLVPRRAALNEHVDDHQVQVAGELAGRGLSIVGQADELGSEHLFTAAQTRIAVRSDAPAFIT